MPDFQSKVKTPSRYGAYDPRSNVIRCYLDGKLMITLSSEACDLLGSKGRDDVLWLWVVMGRVKVQND